VSRPTSARDRLAAQRAAAARARIEAAERRRRLFIVGGSVLVVVLIVAVLVVVKVATGSGPASGKKATSASSQVVQQVSSVPSSVLDAVGVGTAQTPPRAVSGPPLTSGGKPEVLYVGAEYCPYCAAERWAVAVALARFGTLHGVGEVSSSPNDVYPSTATLAFHGASLDSSLLAFTPRELESNQVVNGQYAPLDKLTSAQNALFKKYDAPPYVPSGSSGSIPFVDIGGKYLIHGASYNPGVLQHKTQRQIAAALSHPSSPIAKAVDGTANLITAALCKTTGGKPGAVCGSAGVTAAAAKLGSSS
jgi:thiol-disulfide isomerase/thioredoxin